jgi:hypothetical protein
VLLFVIPFFVFGLKSIFQQSYPISTYESREWCAAFVIPFFVFGLKVFFNSPTNFYLWKQGLSDVLLFVIPFFVFGLKSIFNSPTQFPPMKAGIEWCAALCDSFFVFGLSIFQQSYPISTYESRLSDVLLFCDSFSLVLRVFFNSPTQFPPMKAGIEWCAAPDSFLCVCLKSIFQQSYPISTYESRDWVMCCSLWFLSLCFKSIFQQSYPIPTYESRDWVMCCSFVIPSLRLVLRVFFNSPTNFYLWKQGLSDVLLFVIPFFVFGLKSIFQQSHPILPMKAGIEWCAALCDFLSLCLS